MALASGLQKLLQRPHPSLTTAQKILASIHTPNTSPSVPILTNPIQTGASNSGPNFIDKAEDFGSTHLLSWAFFPIHPFGLFPNPLLPSGSSLDGPEEGPRGDGSGLWADSVKKKRKKKMNKHKYKKLRKRLGRQS